MKQNKNVTRINEGQLRRMIAESVKRVLNEKKLENSFKSKEDMTRYRDMYAPYNDTNIIDTDDSIYDTKTDGGGEWGSGPYMNYRSNDFGSGYDYTGDERYNEYAYDYNDRLRKRLATKGGQMSYDWDKERKRDENDFENAEIKMGRLAKKRDSDKNWRPGQLRTAEKLKKDWLNGDIDDDTLGYYFNESRLRKIVSESIDMVLRKNRK